MHIELIMFFGNSKGISGLELIALVLYSADALLLLLLDQLPEFGFLLFVARHIKEI